MCISRCNVCINNRRILKPFIVETHQVQRSIRGIVESATVRRRTKGVDIIAQTAVITKIETVVFEKYETVPRMPRKGRFWETKSCSRMINGSPFAYIDGANSACARRITGIESWMMTLLAEQLPRLQAGYRSH